MASETYFAIGASVRYARAWSDGIAEPTEAARLYALTGRVIAIDETSRECAYYDVLWKGLGSAIPEDVFVVGDFELTPEGIVTVEQSDALESADSPRNSLLERAVLFATERHAGQSRKAAPGTVPLPYIVHPVDVMSRLVRAGVSDECLLAAAVLHDVVEDCGVSRERLGDLFGEEVAGLVAEVTDPPGISKRKAKDLQVANAPTMSHRAKLLKLADKAANVADIIVHPPGWRPESIVGYSRSAFDVVQALGLEQVRLSDPIVNRLLNDFYAAFDAVRAPRSVEST